MLGFYVVMTFITIVLIGFFVLVRYGDKSINEESIFTAPETSTYKVSGTVTTQNATFTEGCEMYLVPKDGGVPVFIDKGPEGKVYYKPNTNQIIDGNDLILLGDL